MSKIAIKPIGWVRKDLDKIVEVSEKTIKETGANRQNRISKYHRLFRREVRTMIRYEYSDYTTGEIYRDDVVAATYTTFVNGKVIDSYTVRNDNVPKYVIKMNNGTTVARDYLSEIRYVVKNRSVDAIYTNEPLTLDVLKPSKWDGYIA